MGRFPYYSMGGGSIKMRSWKPISLYRFYDWKVMGRSARAISRRKRSIEMTITPSYKGGGSRGENRYIGGLV